MLNTLTMNIIKIKSNLMEIEREYFM
jgi:hypothetical protein